MTVMLKIYKDDSKNEIYKDCKDCEDCEECKECK